MRERLEITTYLIWHIWKARNSWTYNASKVSEIEVVHKAIAEWTEYRDNQMKREAGINVRRLEGFQNAWKYPEVGTVKLNVSSFWEAEDRPVGLGIIARNWLGNTLQASSVTRDALANPVVAEMDAIRVALLVAQQNGWRNVEIQVNIKALLNCLQARGNPIRETVIIAENIYLLAMMFDTCIYIFLATKSLIDHVQI